MLGIIGAMSEEIDVIKKEMTSSEEEKIGNFIFNIGMLRGKEIVLAESGIGKVNSSITATIMIIKYNVDTIVFSGVAGALDERITVGDVVIGEKMIQHDVDVTEFGLKKGEIPRMKTSAFESMPELIKAVEDFKLPGHRIYKGVIISGDQFISSKEVKKNLAKEFNAMCVDMESASVAQACYLLGKNCLIVRSISDSVTDDSVLEYSKFTELAANNSKEIICHLVENYNF